MTVSFLPIKNEHIPLWDQWVQLPHVKDESVFHNGQIVSRFQKI